MGSKKRELVFPPLNDVRWVFLLIATGFDLYAVLSPSYHRTWIQWVVCVIASAGTDALLAFFIRGIFLVPVSGVLTGSGVLLLCDSPVLWPYLFISTISIVSKYALRSEGRHIFNPSNFGLVLALLFFSDVVTVQAGRWGGGLGVADAILLIGLVLVLLARRLEMAIAYLGIFLAGTWVRSRLTGLSFSMLCAPLTGASFQLFFLFMATDPMTTPESVLGQVLFGAGLALIDNILRYHQMRNAPFYALLGLTAVLPVFRSMVRSEDEKENYKELAAKAFSIRLRNPSLMERFSWLASCALAAFTIAISHGLIFSSDSGESSSLRDRAETVLVIETEQTKMIHSAPKDRNGAPHTTLPRPEIVRLSSVKKWLEQGMKDQAIAALDDLHSFDSSVISEMALLYAQNGQKSKALALLDSIQHPTTGQMQQQALVYQDLGECRKAQKIYDRLLQSQPKNASLLSDRAVCKVLVGRLEDAAEDFKAAIHSDPNRWPAHLSLAGVFERSGRFRESLREYNLALQLVAKGESVEHAILDGIRRERTSLLSRHPELNPEMK